MSSRSGSCTGEYLLKQVPVGANGKTFFQNYVVTPHDQSLLKLAAKEDSYRLAYNALVSFLGGLSGLQSNQASWAVTKMYYATFYIARASLCRLGYLIFHVPKQGSSGHTQYELKVSAGERATISPVPSTHKLVARRFQENGYPAFMQGLIVDSLDPIEWLMEQREFWQYRAGRFPDPEFPKILAQLDVQKVQRFLAAYEEDAQGIYLSDPDHALISIPFRLVTWYLALEPFASSGVFTPEDVDHLRKSCITGKQKLTAISRHL